MAHPGKYIVAVSDSPDLSRVDLSRDLLPLFLQRFDRPSTRRAYRSDLVDFFGTERIDLSDVKQISFVLINRYISKLEVSNLKPATIKRRIAALRGFFEWLEALGAIEKNPAHRQLIRKIRSTSAKDRPIIILSAKQAADLIEAAGTSGPASIRDRTLITTILHCVLRRSEAASMNVDHVRPLGRYWIVDLPATKGGADQYVKIPMHVVDLIQEHREYYGIKTGPLWRSVSNNSRGQRLSSSAIYDIVRKTAQKAGLPEIGAHTLRHTGCTLAIEAGASIQQVQTHARHKQIETTMVYVHQRDRLRDSAADYIRLP